jgi:FkbM family methyltransferase
MDMSKFEGSPLELKWNGKDLESLKQVVAMVAEKRIAVQAGACLGVFPKYLSAKFDAVYTFEPSAPLFVRMTKNAPEPNIVRFQAALGCQRGSMLNPVCSLRGNDGKSVLHEGMTRMETGGIIPTMRLDDLALPCCDLIYLDVEGWELYALRGAQETIRRYRPVIACEINRGIEYLGISGDDLRAHIKSLDYEFAVKIRSDEVFLPCH